MTGADWTRRLARGTRGDTSPRRGAPEVPLDQSALALLGEGSSSVDIEHATAAFRLLSLTPSGRDDLQRMVDEKITLVFDTRRGGAGYHPAHRTIVLNRTQVPARTALDYVHEATHARFHLDKKGSDITVSSKERYVRAILFEESRTYFREAVVGRELVHLAGDDAIVKNVLTVHPVQMWFQLAHGAAYHRPPSREVLAADAALSSSDLSAVVDAALPYFQRYVDFYRNVEAAKWEIFHGLRRPEKPEVVRDVLAMCLADQDREWTYPRRR